MASSNAARVSHGTSRWRSPRGRWALAAVIAALASVVLSAVMVFAWAERVLLDEDRFSARIAATLRQDAMNTYLAGELTEQVIARAPELVTVRPAVEAVLSEALRTRTAIVGARAALREAHRDVRAGIAEEAILIDVQAVLTLATALMERGAPDVADRFETSLDTAQLDAGAVGLQTDLFEVLDRLTVFTWPLAVAGALLVGAAVSVAPHRRGGLLLASAGLALAGVVGLIGQRVAEVWLAEQLTASEDARTAIRLAWRSVLHEYRGWNIALLVAGIAGAVGVAGSSQLPNRHAVQQRIAASPWMKTIAGAALAVVGLAVARWPLDAVRVIVLALGVVLAGGGVVLLLRGTMSAIGDIRPGEYAERLRGSRLMITAFTTVAIFTIGAALAVWFASAVRLEPAPVEPPSISVCNGHELLCDLPLTEITFPTTHNSMAAASERGWFFPSQRFGIARQLRDGVRGLMIDTYYGVPSAQGVRTVIDSAVRRGQLVAEHGEEVVEAWERIARRLAPGGEPEIFLCHSFCELGATPMAAALVDIRDYLDAHPGEFVVIFIQDSTSPEDTVREFERTDLAERAYAHDPDEPWPTLGELLLDGKQLLVLAEGEAGAAPWYHPAFEFVQETAYDAPTLVDLDCRPGRGSTDAPFFLMNHWVAEGPKVPSQAIATNTYDVIVERARTCTNERGQVPDFVAVDFYDVGDLFEAVNELNGVPVETPLLPAAGIGGASGS